MYVYQLLLGVNGVGCPLGVVLHNITHTIQAPTITTGAHVHVYVYTPVACVFDKALS